MTDKIFYDSIQNLLPHSQPPCGLSGDIKNIIDEKIWLEDAMLLDVYSSKSKRLKKLVDSVYNEVASIINVSSHSRTKSALKTILINIWLTRFMNKPVKYSRDRSAYAWDRRYGRLYLKYDRMIPLIDALELIGYIEQKKGFYISCEGYGRKSRLWGTPKIWKRFNAYRLDKPGYFCISRPEEEIILRDSSKFKKEVRYINTPAIEQKRKDIKKYNDFQERYEITIDLDKTDKIDYKFLVDTLYHGMVNTSIVIKTIKLYTTILNPVRPYLQIFSPIPYKSIKVSTVPYHTIPSTITQRKLPKSTTVLYLRENCSVDLLTDYLSDLCRNVRSISSIEHYNKYLSERFSLGEIGIKRLEFQLIDESIYRVYNRKSFKLGGRAYGALHQRIPKNMRKKIKINKQRTVELDYSAYHIRMLYHKKGIDYRLDPYEECEGIDMRDTYKVVGLIAINGNEKEPNKVTTVRLKVIDK